MARNGEKFLLSWRPMESTSVYETVSENSAAGWLRALFCVSYFCVPSRVQVCLDFGLFNVLKKAVSAAMLRLFLFVSVCLCLCACSCSLERGVVFLM